MHGNYTSGGYTIHSLGTQDNDVIPYAAAISWNVAVNIHLVLCSCPDRNQADRLAGTLVEERLAACVSVVPMAGSVYRWKGQVERTEETLLLVKTEASRVPALAARIQALHPYELPEVLAVEAAGGLPAYLAWVAEQTREND